MLRSFFSGVSGLQVHLERMDVVGDNLANVNTVGFKKSNMTFKDFLSQTLMISQTPTATLGGVNPKQIGLGVKVGAITVDFTQGQLQTTGKTTDVAVEGTGFFIVQGQGGVSDLHYTRAGAFDFDKNGNLVDPATGAAVQGWNAKVDSTTGQLVISPNVNPIEDVLVKIGQTVSAKATTNVNFSGNLDAGNGRAIDPVQLAYTQNGVSRTIELSFQHTHPTKPYFYYTAKWVTNPPAGYSVNDSVIDANTGKAVAGILELNTDGTVKRSYLNTDDDEVSNAERMTYLDELETGSTVQLKAVKTIEHGNTDPNSAASSDKPGDMAGYWRTTFDNANYLNRYKLEYSQDYNPGDPGSATWSTIASSADRSSDFQIRDDTGASAAGQLIIRATDWAGQSVAGDTLYFRTKKGNGNKIFDFPMEEPKDEDDWPALRASDPVNKNSSGSGTLSNVFVNNIRDVDGTAVAGGRADSATSRPNLSNGLTQTVWRAVYGNSASSTEYKLFYSRSYPSGMNSITKFTWFDETSTVSFNTDTDNINSFYAALRTGGAGSKYNTAPLSRARSQDVISGKRDANNDGDFTDGGDTNTLNAGELFIQSENWNATLGGDLNPTTSGYDGDVYEWRMSYAKSSSTNRDFFTIEETTTRLSVSPSFPMTKSDAGSGNSISLTTVDVQGDAPVDSWTIRFTSSTNYTITGSNFGTLGSGNTGTTFNSSGMKLDPTYWSGTGFNGATFNFSTTSTKILSDIIVPSGNAGSEALTFTPNTTDTTYNEVDSGQPVKATLKAANDYQYAASINVFDSLGTSHVLKTVFERVSQNEWLWSVDDPTPSDVNNVKLAGFGKLTFDEDGMFDASNSEIFESEIGQEMKGSNRPSSLLQVIFDPAEDGGAPPPAEGAARVDIAPDFMSLVQFSSPSDGQISGQDGFGKGTLQELNINQAGIIVGLFDNGQAQDLAQLALAQFVNPSGLLKEGNSYYRTTGNSGTAIIGVAQKGGRGNIIGGALEGSNVDMTVEFTEMIITQRGFQASSRTIRTADQMIQEILALKQ